jgi:hypothetical protein
MSQDFKFSPDGTIRMVHQRKGLDFSSMPLLLLIAIGSTLSRPRLRCLSGHSYARWTVQLGNFCSGKIQSCCSIRYGISWLMLTHSLRPGTATPRDPHRTPTKFSGESGLPALWESSRFCIKSNEYCPTSENIHIISNRISSTHHK